MTARVLVGVYPGEVGYEKAAFDDAGVPGAPCRLLSLPPALLDETLGYVGHISYFIRLLKQTSKTMTALGEERPSLWRQVDTAIIYCSDDFQILESYLTMLERCAPTLRCLGVHDKTWTYERRFSAGYHRTVPLNALLMQTPALRRLFIFSKEFLPALPTGDGALPALEWLGECA